jgi:hypothetical protein
MAARLSTLRTGRALSRKKILGTHFCSRLSRCKAIVRPEGVGKLGIGNRTRDLPGSIIIIMIITGVHALQFEKVAENTPSEALRRKFVTIHSYKVDERP